MKKKILGTIPREFWPWADIAYCYKREVDGEREVLTTSFLGEPVWCPWMGTEER